MKTANRMLCLAACILFGANCNSTDMDIDIDEEEETGEFEAAYVASGFTPQDRTFLTELKNYHAQKGSAANYPMCIFSESASGGVAINNPDAVRKHMTTVVNTWLAHLYNRWSWKVPSVSFTVVAKTEGACPAQYNNFKPFSVTSHNEAAVFGGMPKAIRVRFPGNTINGFADGTSYRQEILHEVGHVFHLGHTLGQVNKSVMDYDDMWSMSGISGDDVIGFTHAWKQISGKVSASTCEFGYTYSGGACVASGGNLGTVKMKNKATGQCIQSSGSGANLALKPATCSAASSQKFDISRNSHANWRLIVNGMCMKVASAQDGAALQQTFCNQNNPDQNFTLLKEEDGSYKVMSEHSRMLIDIKNGVLLQSSPAGKLSQSWTLSP
jgi:Ricin-type beta-trefoil lectin domain